MKTSAFLLAALLAACSPPAAEHVHEHPPESGASFKNGRGLALTDKMKKALGLRSAEVEETHIAPSFSITLLAAPENDGIQPARHSPTTPFAGGWITSAQASLVRPGLEVTLTADGETATSGTIRRIDRERFAIGGDFAVIVESQTPLPIGTRISARFQVEAGEATTSIPRSALLTTAEGTFVYALNDDFYVRTPVKIGAGNEDHVEILDGLYTGDEIVVTPVLPLWLAELQTLRGGHGCAHGH